MALEHTLTLNALREGVLRLDAGGNVIFLNPAAARLLGATAERFLGRPFHDVARHEGAAAVCEPCASLRAGEPLFLPQAVQTFAGVLVPVECRSQPVRLEGALAGTVVVLEDTTERRLAEEARVAALQRSIELERLQEMLQFKTQFINMAAHELNTPLTPILLQLRMLRDMQTGTGPGRDVKGSWDILQRNIERLARLVEDLLEAARLQSGKLELERRRLALPDLAQEAVAIFREAARDAGLELVLKTPAEVWIEGDAARLSQVLFNLLSNALKFTPPGGHVLVRVAVEGDEASVLVRDDGLGLAAEEIPQLFRPFSQVRSAEPRMVRGTGLGLFISKGIVEGHRGRVWCTSPGLGQGSTFGFSLPLPVAKLLEEPLAVRGR